MSLTSSLDIKEQVRQSTDIVELLGQYLTLRHEGRLYKALCPWHDDTRPSLQINPERQSWKCWVCDVGGDVFSFVMQREGVTFPEALAMLADRAGIELRTSRDASGAPVASKKKDLYAAAAWAEQKYHDCLVQEALGQPARDYLHDRGIRDESIRQFHVGFAPNEWDWLVHRAEADGVSTESLEKIGVLGTSARTGRRYDRFKGRVLFSIRDTQARPIAMGGRILPQLADDKSAKYINSPETPLFSKSNQLYGLDVARSAIVADASQRHAIIMEGYTDCLIAHQFGFGQALAVLGTALGERHVRLLSRYADKITLVLDGDVAGQRRANEILDLFVAGQLDLRVLTLPEGLDPCDFLLQRGAEAFAGELAAAVDALDHKIRVATSGVEPGSGSHEANRALEEILATMAKAPRLRSGAAIETKLREDQFLTRLARDFHVPEETVRTRLVGLRRTADRPGYRATEQADAALPRSAEVTDAWERELIEILLQEPEAVSKIAESIAPGQLTDPICRQVFIKCRELSAAGETPHFDRLLLEFDDPAMKSLLVALDERGRDRGGSDLVNQLPDLLASFQLRNEKRERQHAMAALKGKRLDERTEVEILERILNEQRAHHRETHKES